MLHDEGGASSETCKSGGSGEIHAQIASIAGGVASALIEAGFPFRKLPGNKFRFAQVKVRFPDD
jgi:hypothetical protein